MSDEMIVRQCAPTLAGIKTGSLFPCPYESRAQLLDEIRAMNRMRQEDVPHEVGLFLSYPPEDVAGFIANNARRCKCAGLWKVYGDEKRARRMFHAFKACTADYCRHLRSGRSLEELVVAV